MRKRMGRPRLKKRINFKAQIKYFKPQGVPMANLQTIEINKEEIEALRLKNIENLDQKECARKMNTSPATLQRILSQAYKKISSALTKGYAIKIIDN